MVVLGAVCDSNADTVVAVGKYRYPKGKAGVQGAGGRCFYRRMAIAEKGVVAKEGLA